VCVYETESERGERERREECKVSLEDRKIEKMSETAIHGVERERGERRKSRVWVFNPMFFTLCDLV
jgi:hypothetical protein